MRVFVGTYTAPKPHAPGGGGAGILVFELEAGTGALRHLATEPGLADPSYLTCSEDGAALYAVSESDGPGEAAAYAVDRATGALRELDRAPTGGAAPCFASLDADGRRLLVTNYEGGSVAALGIRADGGLEPGGPPVAYTGPSHPHAIVPASTAWPCTASPARRRGWSRSRPSCRSRPAPGRATPRGIRVGPCSTCAPSSRPRSPCWRSTARTG
jgi:6-phosphogluconolactonase (cycloisomerase 2 family)